MRRRVRDGKKDEEAADKKLEAAEEEEEHQKKQKKTSAEADIKERSEKDRTGIERDPPTTHPPPNKIPGRRKRNQKRAGRE